MIIAIASSENIQKDKKMKSREQNNRDGMTQRSIRLRRGMMYTQAKILVVLKTMRFDDRNERLPENLEFKKNTI